MLQWENSSLSGLSRIRNVKSRAITAENFTGEKGKGGMATKGFGAEAAHNLGQGWKVSPAINVKPGEIVTLADIEGPGIIRHIWVVDSCQENRRLILRIYWDGNETPSVEVPLADFFASTNYQTYTQLTSLMVCTNPRRGFNCFWEMPFHKHCRITLESLTDDEILFFYQIDYQLTEIPDDAGYFHAQFRRVNPLPYKSVYTILDNIHGKGHYVGTYLYWGVNNNGWWGEGEVKFYIDGDQEFPTICGTGTEDYFGGAYNFDVDGKYVEYCTPYMGLSKVERPDGTYSSQQRFSMYRWHVVDPIYFSQDLRVTVHALGWRNGGKRYLPLQDDISSVAYWYQQKPDDGNFPPLPDKDYLEII